MTDSLFEHPVHLGPGGHAVQEPVFTGDMDWYAAYGIRHMDDGFEGRLVSIHTFSKPWSSWEVHPNGHEVVVCTNGEITLIQEIEGEEHRSILRAGTYAINAPGVWHTADVSGSATALFITAGVGTQQRPR